MERVKDIQFCSKQRFTTEKVREIQEMRAALARVLAKLSSDLKGDSDVAKLATLCDNRDWTIAHINNRRPSHGGQTKDAEFSRAAVDDRWSAGLEDVRISAANLEWMQPVEAGPGIRIYYLPPASPSMGPAASRTARSLKVADTPEGGEDKPRGVVRPRRMA
jgi:NTE family protein